MFFHIYLFIRNKIREYEAREQLQEQKTSEKSPTTNESHLASETTLGQDHSQQEHGAEKQEPLNAEQAAQQKAERRRRTIRVVKLMLGLALPNFLASLDVTIVAPAIPLISSHFNRLDGSFNWIVAAYTLTFTTFVPASGQLAEIYGRHFALQFEMFWILFGSILCAAAQSWGMLLLGRALQGLGAAGIMSLSRIILSDGATLSENSRANSILSFISGISYAIGPVIGGNLGEHGWRYVFVLPTCVSVLAIVLIFVLMRKDLVRGRVTVAEGESRRHAYINGLRIIDWPGMVTFILGVGIFILALQWGGTSYAWDSPTVVVCFVIGGIITVIFFVYEYLLGPGRIASRFFPNQIPMVPSTLFRKKDTSLLMIINFTAGLSFVSAFYFVSYYWQFAEGYSSSDAGIQLLFFTPGLGVGVYSAMFMCNFWPRQTFFPLMWGSIVEGLGLSLLTYSISIRNPVMVRVFLVFSGAGTGLRFMPVVLHAAGIWSTQIPSIQSLLNFTLPLGETVGISLMGAVYSNKLSTGVTSIAARNRDLNIPAGFPSLEILNSLPPAAKNEFQNAAAQAVKWSLITVMPFVALSITASILLGNVWIGKPAEKAKGDKPATKEEKGKVMYGFYIPAVVTGSVSAKQQDLEQNHGHEEEEELVGEKAGNDVEAGGVLEEPERVFVWGRQHPSFEFERQSSMAYR